jgi:hypothetical protein
MHAANSTKILERETDQIITSCFLVVCLFLLAFVIFYKMGRLPIMFGLVMAGSLGGIVSCLEKIKSIGISKRDRIGGMASVLLSILMGLIFSLVLYLLIAGGLLKGPMFPDLIDKPADTSTFLAFVDADVLKPDTSNYARALFWAFVSGYSQKFVLSIVGRVEKEGERPN